jgi:hypothetical protein
MSKIKNTPEFEAMMADQELAASVHYEETEAERAALMKDLAKLQALEQVRIEYDKAVRELDIAMNNYADAIANLHDLLYEEKSNDSVAQLNDMFKGFNPNS